MKVSPQKPNKPLLQHIVSRNTGEPVHHLSFRFGDILRILDGRKTSRQKQEELLLYLTRLLSLESYDSCSLWIDADESKLKSQKEIEPNQRVCVQVFHSSMFQENRLETYPKELAEIMTPEFLEKIYSYAAFHGDNVAVSEVIAKCVPRSCNPHKDTELFIEHLNEKYPDVQLTKPDIVLPHDNMGHTMVVGKVFYQYRTRTDPGRFQDEEFCRKLTQDLNSIIRLFQLRLLDEGSIFCPYYDDTIGMYRSSCMFVCLNCNDTFYWGSADAEAIPASEFDWIIERLTRSDNPGLESIAICSWLRQCQKPLDRYNTQRFKEKLQAICEAHGKPWELLDTDAAP